jgi:hypothetical protein
VIIKTPYFSLGGTDLTDQVMAVSFSAEKESVDATTSGSAGARENEKGLSSGTVEVTLKDDFTAAAVDKVIWDAFQSDDPTAFEIRTRDVAVSATNPKWTGNCQVTTYNALGELGALAQKKLSLPQTGPATRATS